MFVILSVCLLSSPTTCKMERIEQSVEERPPISCIVEGQSTVATWQQGSSGVAYREVEVRPAQPARHRALRALIIAAGP